MKEKIDFSKTRVASLEEVKELYRTEFIYENDSGFLMNDRGKYRPGISFPLPKNFPVNDDGKLVDPLVYRDVPDISGSIGIDFNAREVEILPGSFWKSKKGTPCFRALFAPERVTHLLVGACWGGPFNHSREYGMYPEDTVMFSPEFFRHRGSNGGGMGIDWWVIKVGQRWIYDDEDLQTGKWVYSEEFKEETLRQLFS